MASELSLSSAFFRGLKRYLKEGRGVPWAFAAALTPFDAVASASLTKGGHRFTSAGRHAIYLAASRRDGLGETYKMARAPLQVMVQATWELSRAGNEPAAWKDAVLSPATFLRCSRRAYTTLSWP